MATAKYKRQKDGFFQAKVWDGTYVNGKKHYQSIRSKKSSRDLENLVKAFESEVEQRKYVKKTDITFLEYARTWECTYKQQCTHNTRAMYQNIIEKHFIILDNALLRDIDRIHLQMLLNHADGKPRTQQQIILTFKQVIRSAAADHLFPANVMDDIFSHIDPIRYHSPEKRPLTAYEKTALFKADFQEQDKIFVYLLYGCGLRRSEALALTVFDIHNHELSISKAHEFINDKPQTKSPKTSNGYRTVPIPDKIYTEVDRYVGALKSTGKTYLFTMRNGKPLTKSSYDKMWARILSRMQEVSTETISGLTAHVFRHNYCTNLCYQIPTISIKKIAQLMGDTERMVLDVYNHIVLEKEDARSAVNSAIDF